MTQKKSDDERVRKAYAQRGTRSQIMFNFRLDLDCWEKLSQQANKGRYINEAIRAYDK